MRGVPGLRQGPWKLILAPGSGGWTAGGGDRPVQLYNLAEDLAETKNLAAEQPERVTQMKAALEKLITDGRSTRGAPQKNDVRGPCRYPAKKKQPARGTRKKAP